MPRRKGTQPQPYRRPPTEGRYADEIVAPGGLRFVVSEWDADETRVRALVAAGAPWAVRRCPPTSTDGGDAVLWPELLDAADRREIARAAIDPWTRTPSKSGTRKLRRGAWQASVWTSGSAELLVFEEG